MKRLWILFLWAGSGWAMDCGYDGQSFEVLHQGKKYAVKAARDYTEARVFCGPKLSSLYDGNDWIVFEGRSGQFRRQAMAHRYGGAALRVWDEWAGFYDGDSVWAFTPKGFVSERAHDFRYAQITLAPGLLGVYDGNKLWRFDGKRWAGETVRRRYRHTRLESSRQFVVLYDGDDLWVWEKGKNTPVSQHVKYQFYFPVLVVGDRALGFYDGQKLHGYCTGKGFRDHKANFDAFATGHPQKSGDIEIRVGGRRHVLQAASCQWN